MTYIYEVVLHAKAENVEYNKILDTFTVNYDQLQTLAKDKPELAEYHVCVYNCNSGQGIFEGNINNY